MYTNKKKSNKTRRHNKWRGGNNNLGGGGGGSDGGRPSILGLVFRFGQILPAGVCSVLICLAPTPHTPLSPKDPVVRVWWSRTNHQPRQCFGETVPVWGTFGRNSSSRLFFPPNFVTHCAPLTDEHQSTGLGWRSSDRFSTVREPGPKINADQLLSVKKSIKWFLHWQSGKETQHLILQNGQNELGSWRKKRVVQKSVFLH